MDQEQLNNAVNSVNNIDTSLIDSNNQLYQINTTLIEIDNKLYSLNELLNKENEQSTEKIDIEKKEETKKSGEEIRSEETEITINTIHEDLQQNNQLLENQVNLLTVNVFAIGILIGTILLSMFWDRYFKK